MFQRSPNYSVPVYNAPLEPAVRDRIKANYADFRAGNQEMTFGFAAAHAISDGLLTEASTAQQQQQLEVTWRIGGLMYLRAFSDLLLDPEANAVAQDFIRNKIREQVNDPALAELLCPQSTMGCKRLCVDTGYYRTYNRDNVALVDLKQDPIQAITAAGILRGVLRGNRRQRLSGVCA